MPTYVKSLQWCHSVPEILNERAASLLKMLVQSYISDGQPVGSKKLAQSAALDISSATVRNVMSSLEQKGLVTAPHTSAGRIPTEQGFRFFVDSLLEIQPLQQEQVSKLKQGLDPDQNTDTLVSHASQLVSELTHMAGVITIPKTSQSVLRHIEFLPLRDKKILAILVVNEKEVQNRVIHVERDYSADELTIVANYLNQEFVGQDVFEIRKNLLSELQHSRQAVDNMMQTAIDVAGKALEETSSDDQAFMVQGEANLVKYNETSDRNQLQQMLEVFDQKRAMLSLLDRCIQSEGVKIYIGKEAGIEGLGECSVITAPYEVEGNMMGVLGVIGPTRINYDKVIPVVDITAKLLSQALKPQ